MVALGLGEHRGRIGCSGFRSEEEKGLFALGSVMKRIRIGCSGFRSEEEKNLFLWVQE